jgi:hypothetical protein
MTHSMVAATIIADLIAGRRNDWLLAFDSKRNVMADAPAETVFNALEVARQFVTDKAKVGFRAVRR